MIRVRAQRSRRPPGLPAGLRVALLTGGAALAGCATLEQEKHVAPLFSEVSAAGGGTLIDALGGAILERTDDEGRPVTRALRPLWFEDLPVEDVRLVDFLVPFGRGTEVPSQQTWRLLPIYSFNRRLIDGREQRTLIALPGVYWAEREGRILRAWFPVGGVLEVFLSFDRIEFVLWPIWLRTERHGRVTTSFLWPIFGVTKNAGGPSWRLWPLFGRSYKAGSWDRRFVLWPFFHYQINHIEKGPEHLERRWMVWPFLGRTRRADYRATSVLWPFFGYARKPSTGFWAWDGPWPLVRFQRGGTDDYERSRVWPFFGYYRGDGLVLHSYLWPLLGTRDEEYRDHEKHVEYAIPFWQYRRTYNRRTETLAEYRKLWPMAWIDTDGRSRSWAFPALNPLWKTPAVDRAYAWMWELFHESRTPEAVRQRSWLGLWRRESDAYEDRRSLVGVWSQRKYRRGGDRYRETSVLFGLLRWRTGGADRLQFLRPAMPGPGWPLVRSTERLDRSRSPEDKP